VGKIKGVRTQRHYTAKFNASKLIDDLGGVAAALRVFKKMGCYVTYKSVESWKTRNRIPSDALAVIAVYMRKQPFDLIDYIDIL
jgi:hypothetical protein